MSFWFCCWGEWPQLSILDSSLSHFSSVFSPTSSTLHHLYYLKFESNWADFCLFIFSCSALLLTGLPRGTDLNLQILSLSLSLSPASPLLFIIFSLGICSYLTLDNYYTHSYIRRVRNTKIWNIKLWSLQISCLNGLSFCSPFQW